MVLALLGGAAIFISIASLLMWATTGRTVNGEARLKQLISNPRPRTLDSPFSDRVLVPVLDGFTRFVVQLLPQSFVSRISHQLITAGRPMSGQAFFTMVVVTGLLCPFTALALLFSRNGGEITATVVALPVVCAALGMIGPIIWLRRRVRGRKLAIWKSLPDTFDLVTVSVEAGLGLDAAMRQVAEKVRGPLSDEIAQMLREVGMGRARREALEDMAQRTNVPEVATFVNAIVQAEQLGTSIGRVLRSQAVMLRIRRRQKAEATARRAPIKMVFPLVLCIMPSFFIVTVGPIFVRFVDYLSK
jgi:tight adherence protein C